MRAAAAIGPVRKCNVCKKTKAWSPEHFDEKRAGGLKVVCRPCSNKRFTGEKARERYRRNRLSTAQGDRTTPVRLCYLVQGGVW